MRLDPTAVHFDADTGALTVDLRPRLDVRLRFGAWADGLPCDRWVGDAWREEPVDPGLDIFYLDPDTDRDDAHPIARYLASVPPDCRTHLRAYRDAHLTLLRLLRESAGRELAAAAPNLLWLIAGALGERGLPVTTYPALLAHRRADLLSWVLRRPASGRHARILERILPTRRDAHTRARVLRLLARPAVLEIVGRSTAITSECLDAALALAQHVNLSAVAEGLRSHDPWSGHGVVRLAADTRALGLALGIRDAARVVARLRRPRDVQRIHQRWVDRANQRDVASTLEDLAARAGTRTFPPAPIEGTEEVVHLGTIDALIAEGHDMHHCASAYAAACFEGSSILFKVLAPERATLELRRIDGRLAIAPLLGIRNQPVTAETVMTVRAWIAEASR